jgi:thiol-disulfide isomerase/thioredoxin
VTFQSASFLVTFQSAFALFLCISTGSIAAPSVPKETVRVGDSPAIKLRDLKGEVHRLADYAYAGVEKRFTKKVVVVDFFSTACAPCKKMLPLLVDFAKRQSAAGVQVLLVAVPEKADTDGSILKSYFQRNPVPFPVLSDRYEDYAKVWVPQKDGTVDLPYMFLVDRDGVVRAVVPGAHESIDEALSPALKSVISK